MALRSTFALVACLLLGPGCGLISSKSKDSSLDSEVLVEIENHHWSDIVIYLMDGSQSDRLGTVAGLSNKRFVFPYHRLTTGGDVRLRAYAVGGSGSATSDDLRMQPGQ
jgi:hypothetical protein